MDFLTPEIFNTLIVLNLLVGVGLIIFRFSRDMTRTPQDRADWREQAYDERSFQSATDSLSEAEAAALLEDHKADDTQYS